MEADDQPSIVFLKSIARRKSALLERPKSLHPCTGPDLQPDVMGKATLELDIEQIVAHEHHVGGLQVDVVHVTDSSLSQRCMTLRSVDGRNTQRVHPDRKIRVELAG